MIKRPTTLQKKEYNFQSLNPSLIRNFLKQYSPHLGVKWPLPDHQYQQFLRLAEEGFQHKDLTHLVPDSNGECPQPDEQIQIQNTHNQVKFKNSKKYS